MTLKNKLVLSREKHIIYIVSSDNPTKLRYDLKRQLMEKYYEKQKKWKSVQHQYDFFRPFSISDIETEEPHFKELINVSMKLNPLCESLSTFINRLNKALIYEGYTQEGVKAQCHVRNCRRSWGSDNILSKPINFYRKDTIRFFKENDIEVTTDIEEDFNRDYDFMSKLVEQIELSSIENPDKIEFFTQSINSEELKDLIKKFNYEPRALIQFVCNYLKPFENLNISESLTLLRDYFDMAHQIGRDVKKYPKYLRSMHDIITSNFNSFKKSYSEKLFSGRVREDLEYEDKKYCVITPKTPKEIISEGTSNNNCVGSYIDKILSGETYLVFMRNSKDKETSLITLEVKGDCLVQYKGAYNRTPTKDEMEFINKYCKLKDIKIV
jgi:hypothetical protein